MEKKLSMQYGSHCRKSSTRSIFFGFAALLCILSSTFLMAKPSWATCKEEKPKNWSTGDAIQSPAPPPPGSPPAPAPTPVLVCAGQSTTVGVTAVDNDHWEVRCKDDDKLLRSGDEGDSLTYSWTGVGTFANPTSASTSWTAPTTSGTVTLTCTIDDVPTVIAAGETGSRDDSAITKTVTICVVDPGHSSHCSCKSYL